MKIGNVLLAGLISAASIGVALPALALDRHVTIVNNTGYTMTHFYGSNKGSDNWEEDILGTDVLPSGSQVDVNFDDASGYCKFDFKADWDDGTSTVAKDINICEIPTFTFN